MDTPRGSTPAFSAYNSAPKTWGLWAPKECPSPPTLSAKEPVLISLLSALPTGNMCYLRIRPEITPRRAVSRISCCRDKVAGVPRTPHGPPGAPPGTSPPQTPHTQPTGGRRMHLPRDSEANGGPNPATRVVARP